MDEYRHVHGLAQANGLAYEMLTPDELRARHPFVELDDLQGALWDPCDGDIDPAQLTQALAAGARQAGARVQRFTRVTGLRQITDRGVAGRRPTRATTSPMWWSTRRAIAPGR